MIMAGGICWALTVILLSHTERLCSAEEVIPITGIQGGSVLLSPAVPPGFNPRKVFWRHLSPTDHLVASFSQGSLDTTYQSCFYGRVQLLQNFTLQITGLELKDNGIFTCQVVDPQGHMKLHQFHLTVYEEVSKPEVQVFVSTEGQDCTIFLSCNVTTGNNLTYSWMTDTGQWDLSNKTYRLYDDQRLLKVALTSALKDVSFTCVVTNPVSQERTSVIPWTSCLAKQGQDSLFSNGKILLLVASFLIIMFTTGMICVYLFTRNTGKTSGKSRQRTNMHTEETILQIEETDELKNEQIGLQHLEETAGQQNGEMTLGCNEERDIHSNGGRTVQFSPETILIQKVETIV